MELRFVDVSAADAADLAEELELALLRAGIPANALSLKLSSPEHMSLGSVLWANVEMASQILGPVAHIASFAKCIYEIVKKNEASIVISANGSTVKLVGSQLTLELAQNAVAGSHTKKAKGRPAPTKSKAKAKAKTKG